MRYLLYILSIALFLFSCKDDDEEENSESYKAYLESSSCLNKNVVNVNDSSIIFIPNLFTPNADGINDILLIGTTIQIDDFNFKLINSSSRIVFNTSDQDFIFGLEPSHRISTSQILSFELTGSYDGLPINESGKISCLVSSSTANDYYDLENCLNCQPPSLWDMDYDSLYAGSADTTFSPICRGVY